ncbi:MAG: hypothetical protein AAGC88_07770 [Bacteroidota bacterium]
MRWLILSALLGYLSSCTQCDECDLFADEPTISLEIFNQDSLTQINALIEDISVEIDAADLSIATLDSTRLAIADTIQALTVLIDSGEVAFESDLLNFESLLTTVNIDYSLDSTQAIILDSINAIYASAQSELESGLTRIDTLINLETGSFIVNTDSVTSYDLPLSPSANQVSLQLVVGSERLDISLAYETELYEDEDSRVGYLARNISLVNHSFDSLSIDCEENCISANGKIVAYH